jgi:hypothetical protein
MILPANSATSYGINNHTASLSAGHYARSSHRSRHFAGKLRRRVMVQNSPNEALANAVQLKHEVSWRESRRLQIF